MNDTDLNITDLIEQFRSFCGLEKYRRFLCVTNTRAVHKRRLLYWQQELWDEFCRDHAVYVRLECDGILNAFSICHIHEQRLHDDMVSAIYGYWRFPQDYLAALDELFPFANMMYCGDSVELEQDPKRKVKYCAACREALIEWNADRKHKIGMS